MSEYYYLSSFDSNGVPIGGTIETIDTKIVNRMLLLLPEGINVYTNNPYLISSTALRNIIIKTNEPGFTNAEIWVTFIFEGAGYRNVFGYFIYDLHDEFLVPTKFDEETQSWTPMTYSDRDLVDENGKSILKKTVIFPNASLHGSGGNLATGYKIKLKYDTENNISVFPNNIGIGFFIIPNGWNGSTVNNTKPRLYTYDEFNPSQKVQTILLSDLLNSNEETGKMLLSFEDIQTTSGGDKDFNDLIINIEYTPSFAIINRNLNSLPEYCFSSDSLVYCKNIVTNEISYKKIKDIDIYTYLVYSVTKNEFISFLANPYLGKQIYTMCIIRKNSLGANVPNEDFYIKKNHPIYINNKEIFPTEIPNIECQKIDCSINTICTKERDYILINGLPVTTWNYEHFINKTFNNKKYRL